MKQIDRKDIYDLYPKLNNPAGGSVTCEAHKIWLLKNWNEIKGHTNILAWNHILINSTYKNARTTLDYYKYKPVLKDKIKPDMIFKSDHPQGKLGYEFFQNIFNRYSITKKFIIVKSDTGTGKTTSFKTYKKYLNESNRKVRDL